MSKIEKITKNKKSPRHLARSIAVQGLYYFKLNCSPVIEIERYLSSNGHPLYLKADQELLHFLLEQSVNQFDKMLNLYANYINTRKLSEINLLEQIILVIAAVELLNNITVPATVIINEAVELAKLYGAEDSYKFINGLVDKLAKQIRNNEMKNHTPT